jgi:hypothetical protein
MRTQSFFAAVALASLLVPAVAFAQEAEPQPSPPAHDSTRGAQAIAEAKKAESSGKIDEACAAYARAQAFDPQSTTLLALALCHEKQGKLATAYGELGEVAAAFGKEGNKERETFARGHAKDLEPKLSYLVLEGTETTKIETFSLDGSPVPKAAWSKPLPLDAGDHALSFAQTGAEPSQAHVRIPTGAAKVPYRLPLLGKSNLAQSDKGEAATTPWLGYGLVAGGVVGLGIGSVFGISTFSARSDADKGCNVAKQCTAESLARIDDGRSSGTISTIAFVAGAVLVGTGLTLILTHKTESKPKTALTMVLTGRGTF